MPAPPYPPPIINRPPPKPPLLQSLGKILAVKLMPEGEKFEWDSEGPAGQGGEVKWYGLAPVLAVQAVVPKVQSTIFIGQSLYMLENVVSIFDKQTGFIMYMNQFINKSKTWAELTQVPIWPKLIRTSAVAGLPQDPPVAMAPLVLLGAGYDPFRGYWVEFQGNFFLGFPLFQPVGGGNYTIAFNGGNVSSQAGAQALTANGFDMPVGEFGGIRTKKC